GMTHPFMAAAASGLAERGIATLRFQFPYMEQGSKRPDSPKLAHAAVRAAVLEASQLSLPLFAGGKSMGGRMTTQAQAEAPLPGVRGIALLGFPLHPAREPSVVRAGHLPRVAIPLLFLQGPRDELADLTLLRPIVERLPRAELRIIEGADHSFHVLRLREQSDAVLSVPGARASVEAVQTGQVQLRGLQVDGGEVDVFFRLVGCLR